jgi:hypothetical protein
VFLVDHPRPTTRQGSGGGPPPKFYEDRDILGIEDQGANGFGGVCLAHNVRSRPEVDKVLNEATNAGAEITQAARKTFYGGYAGCFTDPDGHAWEVAYNPGIPLGRDGAIKLPDFGAS